MISGDDDARASVAAFLGHNKPTGKRPRERRMSSFTAAVVDAEKRSASGDWQDANGRTLVGLYGFCHKLVYGVMCEDLQEKGTFARAAKLATTCLHKHFDDDVDEAVEFITWTWKREQSRETWARGKGVARNRLGFGLQFSAALVTDYRVDRQRRRSGRGRR